MRKVKVGLNWVDVLAYGEGHSDFLEGCITGSFPDAVNGPFNLVDARVNGRQTVGHCQP